MERRPYRDRGLGGASLQQLGGDQRATSSYGYVQWSGAVEILRDPSESIDRSISDATRASTIDSCASRWRTAQSMSACWPIRDLSRPRRPRIPLDERMHE